MSDQTSSNGMGVVLGYCLPAGVALLCSNFETAKQDEQIQQAELHHAETMEQEYSADLRFDGDAMIYVEPTKAGYLNLKAVAPGMLKNRTGLLELKNFGKGSATEIRLTFALTENDRHEVKAMECLNLLPGETMTVKACPGQGFKLSNGKNYVSAIVKFKDQCNEDRTSVTHFEADLDLKQGRLILTVIDNEGESGHDRTKSLGGYVNFREGLRI